MLSGILILAIALFSLIALMVIHEFGHFIIAKRFGIKVEEFGIGYPPRLFGKKIGETVYSVNLIPLGAFVKIYGEEGGVEDIKSFTNLKIWQRALIVAGGVLAFWIAAIIIFSVVFTTGADLPVGDQDVQGMTNARVVISYISADSPAQAAGFKKGDVVKRLVVGEFKEGVEAMNIGIIKDFQNLTKDREGEQITAFIQRGSKELRLQFSPRANPPAGQGAVGVGLERIATLLEKSPWYLSPVKGVQYTWYLTSGTVVGLYNIFAGFVAGQGLPQGAEPAGPLGITVFLANAASYGLGFFLYFIGAISVFVAVFNLFPIPALDGGKLLFLLIEKIKGRPVSAMVEHGITVVCFILLICLSLFVTVRFDIPRFTDFLKFSFQ